MTRLCSSTASDTGRRALQILIVNDDATQRSLISLAAKQAGHAVIMAATNADAIRVVRHVQFDCVTLDIMLDDGDVTKVLKAIAETEFRGLVVVISGMDAAPPIAARLYARSLGRAAESAEACRSCCIAHLSADLARTRLASLCSIARAASKWKMLQRSIDPDRLRKPFPDR
jgi:CheY-like chemotaxis protein